MLSGVNTIYEDKIVISFPGLKKKAELTVFFLHDPGLELDVLHHCEQCVRHEYRRDAQSRYDDGEYVGLYADHLPGGARTMQ